MKLSVDASVEDTNEFQQEIQTTQIGLMTALNILSVGVIVPTAVS